MHRGGIDLLLHYYVGFLEPLLHVANPELEVVRDVGALAGVFIGHKAAGPQPRVGQAGQPLVKQRRILFHRRLIIKHRRQDLVLNVDEGQGFLGQMRAGGSQRGHGVPLV